MCGNLSETGVSACIQLPRAACIAPFVCSFAISCSCMDCMGVCCACKQSDIKKNHVLRALPFSPYSPRHRPKHGHRRPPHPTRNHPPPTSSEPLPSARVSIGRHTAHRRAVGLRVATPHHRRARAKTGASMVHVTVRETRSPAMASGGAVVASPLPPPPPLPSSTSAATAPMST